MDSTTNLLVIIVCYRVADITIDCLRSLRDEIAMTPNAKVIVCDNGSGDGSYRELQKAIKLEGWQSWVGLRALPCNLGFSAGNNSILREAITQNDLPDNILLLNPDTIVRSGAVQELMQAAQRHPEAGIIGPQLEFSDGTPRVTCFRNIHPLSELIRGAQTGPITRLFRRFDVPMGVFDQPIKPFWTTLGCALIRREVFRDVGVLDEGFFLYFEDTDFCRRARNAGWQVLHWPAARVMHLGGQSGPVRSLKLERRRLPRYFYASRARYLAKYYGTSGLWLSNLLWTVGRTVSWARETFGARATQTCENELRDIWIGALAPLRNAPSRHQSCCGPAAHTHPKVGDAPKG